MLTTYSAAADEIQAIVKSVWDTLNVAFALGYEPEMRWPGVEEPDAPPRGKYWGRTSIQSVVSGQIAFGSNKYHDINLLFVQLFCPRNVANSVPNGRVIAELIRSEFRKPSPSTNLWFRDQTIRELKPEADFYPMNIVVTFEYETIQ